MVHNKTGFKDLGELDSTLPDEAVQKLNVNKSMEEPNRNITFTKKLLEKDVISDKKHKKVGIFLEVNNVDNHDNKHKLVDYSVPVVSGSYMYDRINSVAYIGSVVVQDGLRGRGLGTQMKKHMNNMIEQEISGITCYTWTATDGGEVLADKSGFTSDTEHFPDVEEIWSRDF